MISQMLLVAALLLSCSEQAETKVPVVIEEPDPIGLAFSCVSSSSRADTRMTNDVVQTSAPYRAISNFRFFAFKEGTLISATVDHQENLNTYYHYSYCNMPMLTNGCLVYAKAVDVPKSADDPQTADLKTKAYNGCLNAFIPDHVTSTDDIYFEPEPIHGDDGIPADAWTLANALTDIANIEYWNTLNETNLKPLLAHFTNNGYDLAGSAASVRAWIGALKKAAVDMGNQGDGQTEELIRQEIISKANEYLGLTNPVSDKSISSMVYPQNINLPDGAAVLRWTEVEEVTDGVKTKVKKFVPQLQTTTLDDINSVSRFIYPPSLYYFVDSPIWTSNSPRSFDQYKEKDHWKKENENDNDAVQNLFTSGGIILSGTQTVAVADPLQYAVARLNLTVEVGSDITNLKYNGTNTIAYKDGDNYFFRLTGVIVGGQRKVGYDFKPTDNSDLDVKFVYDSQVASGLYLKKKTEYPSSTLVPVNTLVLQSWDDEDVNVILEFEYTGTESFKCLNGYVYPGTRFYLVGEVKAKDFKEGTGDVASRGRVFTQDYTTTIEMTVKSLEKAYNVLPNIIAKNLEVGVMTTPKWKAATPSAPIIME